jgi:hypothetical protein
MKTREEIKAALRFAEQQYAKAEWVKNSSRYNTPEYCQAQGFSALWAGRIHAYLFVLNEEKPA